MNASSMRARRPRIALAPCGGQAGEVITDIRLDYLLLEPRKLPNHCCEGICCLDCSVHPFCAAPVPTVSRYEARTNSDTTLCFSSSWQVVSAVGTCAYAQPSKADSVTIGLIDRAVSKPPKGARCDQSVLYQGGIWHSGPARLCANSQHDKSYA